MATPPGVSADLDMITETIEQFRVMLAGYDQAESARANSPKIIYSGLRTKVEQCEKALGRIRSALGPEPLVEPCMGPVTAPTDGGPQ